MTFGVSDTQLKVFLTCCGAVCSLELPLRPLHLRSCPGRRRLSSCCSWRPRHLSSQTDLVHDLINFIIIFLEHPFFWLRIPQGICMVYKTRGSLVSKNSTGSGIQRLAFKLLGLETSLSINTPQMCVFLTVSSSSPPMLLAKASGHSLSSYFRL